MCVCVCVMGEGVSSPMLLPELRVVRKKTRVRESKEEGKKDPSSVIHG